MSLDAIFHKNSEEHLYLHPRSLLNVQTYFTSHVFNIPQESFSIMIFSKRDSCQALPLLLKDLHVAVDLHWE